MVKVTVGTVLVAKLSHHKNRETSEGLQTHCCRMDFENKFIVKVDKDMENNSTQNDANDLPTTNAVAAATTNI